MFERRLKIFLAVLLAFCGVLIFRAGQLQLVESQEWQKLAARTLQGTPTPVETVRGAIHDFRGREIAVDQPCIDACVSYAVIVPEPDSAWVGRRANERITARGDKVTKERKAAEVKQVLSDIDHMWATLAALPGQSPEAIEETRQRIVQRVEMQRRSIWFHRYRTALNKEPAPEDESWYTRLLESDKTIDLDQFGDVIVGDQRRTHVIIPAISAEVNNYLAKNADKLPGLELKPGIHRFYPYGEVACHLVGNLSRVTAEDFANHVNDGLDDRERYLPNDLIGRSGLESLCEPVLHGKRGQILRDAREDKIVDRIEAEPGMDVTSTIDIELQAEIQNLFAHAHVPRTKEITEEHEMHGAAVVIDIASNEVRALVSYPVFDPNKLEENYAKLVDDDINRPLMNRATQDMLEPGSGVKPMVGLGAITSGVIRVDDTIECTGFLILNGKQMPSGRCWTAQRFMHSLPALVPHHQIPPDAPHPTGFLTVQDAIQRSCNVYFETLADRMGAPLLSDWFSRFGLGRPTGIGIAESFGHIPSQANRQLQRMDVCFSGIGQDQVLATPLQMANVAATIARDGIWERPRLVTGVKVLHPATQPVGPDRVDLQLSPEGLIAVKRGMVLVVNSRAGGGGALHRDDVVVAGKTGTAQASPLLVAKRDEQGRIVKDENGKVVKVLLPLNTLADPHPETPWYIGTGQSGADIAHAWFLGFAPADHPRIAFCVMVEYGGPGGSMAAPIARDILETCIQHGYLSPASVTAGAERELIR
jgi:penicillin-binding protein 2